MARVNVGTSTRSTATAYSNQRKIVKTSDGTLVLFAVTGTTSGTRLQYKVSTNDGATWSASWIAAYQVANVNDFDVCIDTNNDILLCISISTYTRFVKLAYSAGAWTAGTIYTPNSAGHSKSSIARRSNGDIWITSGKGNNYIYYYISTDEGVNWSPYTYDTGGANYINVTQILKNGTDIWVFAINNGVVQCHIYDSSWSTVTIEDLGVTSAGYEAVATKVNSTEIWCAVRTTSGIKVYNYNGSTWDAGTLISDDTTDSSPTLSIIGTNAIICWDDWSGTYWQTAYRVYNGSSWDTQVTLTSDSVNNRFTSSIIIDTSTLYLGCTNGASSPYIVYFDKVVFTIPPVQKTILSDAEIYIPHETILSDALIIIPSSQKDILSDAKIKATDIQDTILSDALIVERIQKNILSDASISATFQNTILSDAKLCTEELYDVDNKVSFIAQFLSDVNNKFNSVIRVLSDVNNFINTCKGFILDANNDFRMRGLGIQDVNNDVRFLKPYQLPGPAGFQSLGKTYIHVYFGDDEQTDVDIDSIEIHKILNGSHTASLDLARAYDVNVPALETVVTIYYDYYLLYKGYITEINPAESPEKINVICNDNYWLQNRNTKYFFVGHEPVENVAPNVVETYYPTPKTALATEVSLNVDFGNFVPQTIGCFGTPESDAISSLIESSGNFGWYYDVDDTKKIWRAGQGSIIDINRQVLGSNIKLYDLLNHQFKKDASNVVNRFRVQMGNRTYVGSREYSSYSFSNYAQFVVPAWDTSIPLISSNDSVSTWVNHSAEDASLYTDVLKKYTLPYLNPKLSQYSDVRPSYVEIFSIGGNFGFVGPLNLQYEKTLFEGFSIDFENRTITFNDPLFLYQPDNNGEPINIRQPIIKVYLWKKELHSYTDDPANNPLVFYTPKMGSYPVTITKELNLSDLSISDGATWKYYDGVTHQIPQYDDTAFATDIAEWNLSKTQEERINGNIEVTLDTLCYYGIDLTKRINITGITSAPMNILSIDIKLSNFKVSLSLNNSQPYQRTVSMSYRGE